MVLTQRIKTALALVILLGCQSAGDVVPHRITGVTVYYLPFSVMTISPVTVHSIERAARCVFSFDPSAEEIATLQQWFARVTGNGFDRKRVRLKMIGLEAEPMYVDRDGGYRRGRATVGKLEAGAFEALEEFVEERALRAGCDPHD